MDFVSDARRPMTKFINALISVGGFTKKLLIWWLDRAFGTIRRAHVSAVSHAVWNLSGDWQFLEACKEVFVSEYLINILTYKNCTLIQWVDAIKSINMQNILLLDAGKYDADINWNNLSACNNRDQLTKNVT